MSDPIAFLIIRVVLRRVPGIALAPLAALAVLPAVAGPEPDAVPASFPLPAWQDAVSPLASPHAVTGGRIRWYAGAYPRSLNGFLENNVFTWQVFGMLYESLLNTDPLTADYVPGLARRWWISPDQRTFTFEIDPDARWSDGRPVLAQDVRWTYDQIMHPDHLTGPHKIALGGFSPPEVLDERTIRFQAHDVHWRHLGAAGGMTVMPRHAFEDRDFNALHFDFPVVSGPYRLSHRAENIELQLERRPDWWGAGRLSNRHTLNFQTLVYRFYAERENAFEAFKQGALDVYPVYTARIWVHETRGERFDRNWIIRRQVRNYRPVGFQGFAMNMRRPPFDDVRVRRAMAHLLNRDKLNASLMYNQYFLHRSYFEDLYDADHPCENPRYAYDPEKARELLREAGWQADPATGLLSRDGRPFRFTFLSREASLERFMAIYADDLRHAGIEMRIERKDAAAWSRDMDSFHFDMTWAAWGSGLFKDPESQWHSREADSPGSNNITGFADPRVDALIERQQTLFDIQARNAILREIDAMLTEACPYVLLWNTRSTRLLYWDRFGKPPQILSRFGDERALLSYWWFDPDSDAELAAAMHGGYSLPARAVEVDFDVRFPGSP